MDLIRTDINGREMGYVLNANIDVEIGEAKDALNDFEVEFRRENWTREITHGCRLIAVNTEYGGIVKEIETNTDAETITVKGYT